MSNKFLDKYKNNESLSINDKKELVSLFSGDLCFDEVFAKPMISPTDLASILQKYGSFWVTIDSDSSNRRQPHAVVVCDISKDNKETCIIKYLDVADGEIKETNFTDFIIRVKDGADDLKTAVVRPIRNFKEGRTPIVNIKCPLTIDKVRTNCIVDIYFKVSDAATDWFEVLVDEEYSIKLTSADGIIIVNDSIAVESNDTFYATISSATVGSGTLEVNINSKFKTIYTFNFVDEKSVFNRGDRDNLVGLNSTLVKGGSAYDSVCFRVADKGFSKLLNDPSLILSNYTGLSGFTRMDDYRTKGYLYKEKKFDQNTIWKRDTENGYNLKPFAFRSGQSDCFSKFVKETMPCMGIHVYHYILLNGFHVLILLVDNTNSCYPQYKILDQLWDRSWDKLSNLDKALLEMTRNNYEAACNASSRIDIDSSINLCKIQSK
ncbi:MAG TPA: hypothetical protein VK169_14525 [Saprospiraceae bacterium]|nr:hypothetical protein [Saprospiraceae bacterium]